MPRRSCREWMRVIITSTRARYLISNPLSAIAAPRWWAPSPRRDPALSTPGSDEYAVRSDKARALLDRHARLDQVACLEKGEGGSWVVKRWRAQGAAFGSVPTGCAWRQ